MDAFQHIKNSGKSFAKYDNFDVVVNSGYEWWGLSMTYKCTRISWLNALVHWNYEGVAAGKRSFLFPVKLRLLFVERKCSEQQNRDVFDLNLLSDRFLFTSRSILRWESFGNAWNVRSFLLSDLLVHSTAAQHLCEDFCAALFDPALSDTASAMITRQVQGVSVYYAGYNQLAQGDYNGLENKFLNRRKTLFHKALKMQQSLG